MNFFCLLQWMRKMGRKSVGISIILIIAAAYFQQALRPSRPSCFCPPLSPPTELVQGAAMSTAAVMPFRSFVQTPIFSVSPSSFSLQRI